MGRKSKSSKNTSRRDSKRKRELEREESEEELPDLEEDQELFMTFMKNRAAGTGTGKGGKKMCTGKTTTEKNEGKDRVKIEEKSSVKVAKEVLEHEDRVSSRTRSRSKGRASCGREKKHDTKNSDSTSTEEKTNSKPSQPPPTVAPDPSKSSDYRVKGNEYYKQFISSTNFQGQKSYLQTAIQFYRQAYDAATEYSEYCTTYNVRRSQNSSEQDASSAAKNCGTAAWKLLGVLDEINAHPETVERQYREAIEFFSKALASSKTCQTNDWIADIKKRYIECIESAMNRLKKDLPVDERGRAIENHIQVMAENSLKSKYFMEIANLSFRSGVVSLGDKDFKAALHAFHECHRPIEECKRFNNQREINQGLDDDVDFEVETRIMEGDVVFHLASAEALQAISIGDQLRKSLQDHETLSMDIVYEVIDWYKKAIVGAREIDVEVEAIALSRLGCLYDEVLKIKYKAKEYFLRCMQLGVSLFPKNTNKEIWFIKCMKALKRYQQEATKNDDSAQQEDHKKYIEELKDELKKLNDENCPSRPSIDLLRFVYKTFPPKDPKHTLDEEGIKEGGRFKKVLVKAILHYHPDKQDMKKYGKKWQVLCGEITKAFTNRYEGCKLDPNFVFNTDE